ncbi:MAG: hypothetical protein M1497_02800 [Nitrospirae bacterium]|nr:hypothetical protein [Nitrospirota bacterium]
MSEEQLREEILSLKTEIGRLRKALSGLTASLPVLLRRRGFRIYKKEPSDDLLLPAKRYIDEYYRFLHRYSFRLFLRDVIKRQSGFAVGDVTRYATQGVTEEYVAFLRRIGLAGKRGGEGGSYRLKKKPVKSFGPTLEWFLSEVFKREFGAEAIWGIKFKRPAVGGDYDLIAKMDGSLLYMEIKSSPPRQIYANEISAFLDRILDLAPEIAVFFIDTELRMKDKIVPMFEEELGKRPPGAFSSCAGRGVSSGRSSPIERIEKELFQAENKIFIINAKGSIVNNVEKVLSSYFRKARK